MNVGRVLGITRQGNGIARQMHQAKRELYTNVIVTGSMGANMFSSVAAKEPTAFTASAGVGYLSLKNIILADKKITKLLPEYMKIVNRAESIYKGKFNKENIYS